MGEKGLDFKHKEVINITDAKKLGYVQDVTADLKTGVITSIIVPGNNKRFNIFSSDNEIIIPWEKIKTIGDEVILVEIWNNKVLKITNKKHLQRNKYYVNIILRSNKNKETTRRNKKLKKLSKNVLTCKYELC